MKRPLPRHAGFWVAGSWAAVTACMSAAGTSPHGDGPTASGSSSAQGSAASGAATSGASSTVTGSRLSSSSGRESVTVALPGAEAGVWFDDLYYSSGLHAVIAADQTTGSVHLFDTQSQVRTFVAWGNPETACAGGGWVFAVDRGLAQLAVMDPAAHTVVAVANLAPTNHDYVRFVEATHEVWITQPGDERIEVLSVPTAGVPTPVHTLYLSTPGAPEGLVVDETRRRAYVHAFDGTVQAIDVDSHTVVATWPMGCPNQDTHGIPALDEDRGYLFVGCRTAHMVVLDVVHDGAKVGDYALASGGASLMGYSRVLRHAYLRGDPGLPVAVLAVAPGGALTPLGTVQGSQRGHCLTADETGRAWTGDANAGTLLGLMDPYPATAP